MRRALKFWPLILLCLLIASRWMFTNAWPGTESTAASQAVAAALAAVVCFAASRFWNTYERTKVSWSPALAGAMLFAGMHSGVLAGNATPRGNDLLIALSLVSAVIAVATAARGQGGAGLSGMEIAPGILAPAGLLLLYTQPAFRNAGDDITMLLTPLCAGLGAVWLASRTSEPFAAGTAAIASAGATILFALAAILTHFRLSLPAVAFDLAEVILALLTLARLGARRFSALFVLVPLLLLLEGLAIVQVRPNYEQVGGLLMLIVALVLLLRSGQAAREENTSLFP